MSTPQRQLSIDQYRGLAILLMVAVNYLAGVHGVPAWAKHAPDVGLTFVDVVAPMFIFAIGLTYGASFAHRRARDGARACHGHFVRRGLVLIGIGAVLTSGEFMTGATTARYPWGVLEAIGGAILLALPVVARPVWLRLLVAGAVLALYQLLFEQVWGELVLTSGHGGLPGTLSWAAMLLLATALGDLMRQRGWRWLAAATAALLLAGLALALLVPLSKNRVSPSYVLVATALSAAVYLAFHLVNDRLGRRLPLLDSWGMNPLVLYVAHQVLLAAVFFPPWPGWYAEAGPLTVALQLAVLLGLLSLGARALERRGIFISV